MGSYLTYEAIIESCIMANFQVPQHVRYSFLAHETPQNNGFGLHIARMTTGRRICMQLIMVGLSMFVMVNLFLWIFTIVDYHPVPIPVHNEYFILENHSLHEKFYYLSIKASSEDCRQLCSKTGVCQAYTTNVSNNDAETNCHFSRFSPLEMRSAPITDSSSNIYVKNPKHDEVLMTDQSAYYAVLQPMSSRLARSHCKDNFYHLALALPGNVAMRMIKIYHKNSLRYREDSHENIGFFFDYFQKVHDHNQSISTIPNEFVALLDYESEHFQFIKRALYYDGSLHIVSPGWNKLGYPFCQGTPFNLMNESTLLDMPFYPGDLPLPKHQNHSEVKRVNEAYFAQNPGLSRTKSNQAHAISY